MRLADIAMYEAKGHGRNKVAAALPDAMNVVTI